MNGAGFHGALLGLVGSVVAVGALWDVYRYRIPNLLTFTAMGAGLAYHAGLGPDARGVVFAFSGLVLLLAIGFALFTRGWMGAGDAKLLGAVGAFLGPNTGVSAFLYASAIGGIWALAWVRLTSPRGAREAGSLRGRPVPYGFAIAAGTIVSFAFPLLK
jgi:Flp pilus assembly protein protease CpaA